MIGRIYKITSPSTDKIYIGSTTKTLSYRFSSHKINHCSSIEIINYGDSKIELLEEFECQDKDELKWKEREYQERFKENCVNQRRAITTDDELLEYRNSYAKSWHKKNKEKRREKRKAKDQEKKAVRLAASVIA